MGQGVFYVTGKNTCMAVLGRFRCAVAFVDTKLKYVCLHFGLWGFPTNVGSCLGEDYREVVFVSPDQGESPAI